MFIEIRPSESQGYPAKMLVNADTINMIVPWGDRQTMVRFKVVNNYASTLVLDNSYEDIKHQLIGEGRHETGNSEITTQQVVED